MVRRRQLHRQQRANTCAVASLRTVLDLQYNVKIAEKALEVLGTDAHFPILKNGTHSGALRKMVKGASAALNTGTPWTLMLRLHGDLDDLRAVLHVGRFPLVTVYVADQNEYHMIVVLDVTGDQVFLWDPSVKDHQPVWMSHSDFMAWWICPKRGYTEYAVVGGGTLTSLKGSS